MMTMFNERSAQHSYQDLDEQYWGSRRRRVRRAVPIVIGVFAVASGTSLGLGAPVLAGILLAVLAGLCVLLAAALI